MQHQISHIFSGVLIFCRWWNANEIALYFEQSKLLSVSCGLKSDNVDALVARPSSIDMYANLRDGSGQELMCTNDSLSWWKPQHSQWNTDGHVHIHSALFVTNGLAQTGFDWDGWVKLDYGDNKYSGSVSDRNKDGTELLLLLGNGGFGARDELWYAFFVCCETM